MLKKSSITLLLPLIALAWILGGCLGEQPPQLPKNRTNANLLPWWYLHPPVSDAEKFYGFGRGESEKEALAKARSNLVYNIVASAESELYRRKERKVLGKEQYAVAESIVSSLPSSAIELVKEGRFHPSEISLLVALQKKLFIRRLKDRLGKERLSLERMWKNVRKKPILERYLTLAEILKKTGAMSSEYRLLTAIAPDARKDERLFGKRRAYFENEWATIRKKITFCIDPVATPAQKIFAKDVKEILEEKGWPVVTHRSTDSNSVCISIRGKLSHRYDNSKNIHRFDADLKLIFHPRFQKRGIVESLKVTGLSADSGPEALRDASERFVKRLRRRFPVIELRDISLR